MNNSTRVVPDLITLNPDGARPSRIWGRPEPSRIRLLAELVLGSQNNMLDETNGVNNAVSCYEEAVQFSAPLVTSLFANF